MNNREFDFLSKLSADMHKLNISTDTKGTATVHS